MEEHTYQLNVELQVHSARTNPKDVEARWHSLLSQLIEVGDDCAVVSAIKCAKVHKFDEAHFSRPDAKLLDLWVNVAIDVIAHLVEDGADGGFDAPAEVLVKSRWPNVVDWECSGVTYSKGVVTLHDLYVAEALPLLEGTKNAGATGKLLTAGCDVVHPESGEILAESDDIFRLPHPVAEHAIAVARAYPHFYIVVENACHIVIADATREV